MFDEELMNARDHVTSEPQITRHENTELLADDCQGSTRNQDSYRRAVGPGKHSPRPRAIRLNVFAHFLLKRSEPAARQQAALLVPAAHQQAVLRWGSIYDSHFPCYVSRACVSRANEDVPRREMKERYLGMCQLLIARLCAVEGTSKVVVSSVEDVSTFLKGVWMPVFIPFWFLYP